MKTIIFVCLLSLSMCLSQPTPKSEAPLPTQQAPTDPKTQTTANVDDKAAQKATSSEAPKTEPTPHPTEASDGNKTTLNKEKPAESIDNKTDKKNPKDVPEKQPIEKVPSASTETNPAKLVTPATNEIKPTDSNANKAVAPTDKQKKKEEEDKTTVHPAVVTPTLAPNVTEKPTVLARGFDGASFVGGIILTLGLLAIGFMGFKYYKNQTERNYHTL